MPRKLKRLNARVRKKLKMLNVLPKTLIKPKRKPKTN